MLARPPGEGSGVGRDVGKGLGDDRGELALQARDLRPQRSPRQALGVPALLLIPDPRGERIARPEHRTPTEVDVRIDHLLLLTLAHAVLLSADRSV